MKGVSSFSAIFPRAHVYGKCLIYVTHSLSQIFTVAASPSLGWKLYLPSSTFFSGAMSSAHGNAVYTSPSAWDTRSLSRECAAGSSPYVATRTIPSSWRALLCTQATILPHDMLKVHGGEKRKEKPRKHGRRSAWISSFVYGWLFYITRSQPD